MEMDLAAEIRAEAARQDVSVSTLAERTGLAYRTVTRKTNGETPLTWSDVQAFAHALGIQPSELVLSAEQHATPAAA